MKSEESREFETIPLESLSEEQIQYFASQLRKEYEFLGVEESEVFIKELNELIKNYLE